MDLSEYTSYLLSLRDYSVWSFRDKCIKKFPDDVESVEAVILVFMDKGYLDDVRFARNFIRSEFQKENGPRKIYAKLLQKGIDKNLIESSLSDFFKTVQIDFLLKKLLDRKQNQLISRYPEIEKHELKQRIVRFLASKGFDYADIEGVLESF